jgi:hypothetical protein
MAILRAFFRRAISRRCRASSAARSWRGNGVLETAFSASFIVEPSVAGSCDGHRTRKTLASTRPRSQSRLGLR